MSHRLQVLISPELDIQLSKAAERSRVSKGEWVRRALVEILERSQQRSQAEDPVEKLASLNAPTADIDDMLEEIERGRR